MCDAQSDLPPPLSSAFAAPAGRSSHGSSSSSSLRMGAACSGSQVPQTELIDGTPPQPNQQAHEQHSASASSSSAPTHVAAADGVSINVAAISSHPNVRLSAPQPSPATHLHRPSPVVIHTKLIKTRTPAGGKTINGRLLMHELGEGATAEVTLCQDPLTGDLYALKKMSKRALSKQKEYGMGPLGRPKITTGLDKVRREIDLMRQVWHPNVLVLESVIDDPDEDALILVLEYAPQGQVMEFDSKRLKYRNHIFSVAGSPTTPAPAPASSNNVALDSPPAAVAAPVSSTSTTSTAASADSSSHDKPISESILRKILHDVLAGLEYLHSLRIVHRDIKPDNLLLASDGSVKIGDLGVARQFGAEEAALISETQGTFHFFSPEMCGGERYCPFKSDLWSLGVTLFILATGGVVPFMSADDNPQELFTAIADHRQGQLPYPPDVRVSEPLRELIDLILDPNPNTRLSIQQIRDHSWMSDHAPSPLLNDMQKMAINEPIVVPTV